MVSTVGFAIFTVENWKNCCPDEISAQQPISLSGHTGFNLAIGVAAFKLGLPRQ
jgi:hypothetical protein